MTSPAAVKADKPGNTPLIAAGPGGGGRLGTALNAVWNSNEDRLFRIFVMVSLAVHSLVFVVHSLGFLHPTPPLVDDEWASIDADLLPDLESTAPLKTALPNAAPAPEAKVPEQMLPQLPKQVTVESQAKVEDVFVEEKAKEEEEKRKAEEEEAKREAERKKAEELELLRKKEEANKLELADLQKRAALEKLRQQEKTAKQMEAPDKDPMAKLAELVSKNDKLNKGAVASLAMQSKARKYGALLKAAVQQNYSLPEAYNLRGATLKVMIAIAVNDRGELSELRIEQSSGDVGFDTLTLDAVKASAPLPRPPPEMAGQSIVLMFTP